MCVQFSSWAKSPHTHPSRRECCTVLQMSKIGKKKKKRLQCKLIMKEVSLLSWQSRNEWVSDWRWVICVTQLSWSVCVTLWRKQFIYPQLEARAGLIRVGWGRVGVGVAPMYNHNQCFSFSFFAPAVLIISCNKHVITNRWWEETVGPQLGWDKFRMISTTRVQRQIHLWSPKRQNHASEKLNSRV